MADRKITDMSALAAGSQATGDLIAVVDVSEGAAVNKNKKMTMENLFKGIPGNVGIGASSPSSILTVQASGTQQSLFSARANGGSGGGMVLQSDASDDGLLRLYDSAGAVQVQLDTDGGDNYIAKGNVGVGTSGPGRLLQIGEGDTGVGSNVHTIARIEGRAVLGGQQVATLEFNQVTNAPSEFVGASIGIESSAGTRSESELVFNVSQIANTDATEAMRLTHDGRLGIDTTDPAGKFVVSNAGGEGFEVFPGQSSDLNSFYNYNRGSNAYISYRVFADTHQFYRQGSAEVVRIDSSGRLLVGTSSSPSVGGGQYSLAVVQGYAGGATGAGDFSLQRGEAATAMSSGDDLGYIKFNDNAGNTFAHISALVDATPGASDHPGRLVFSTTADGASSPTERMRLTSTGQLSSIYVSGIGHRIGSTLSAGSNNLIQGGHSASDIANMTTSFIVSSNGNVTNTNNSYGAISDAKLKENIVSAGSQWDDLKALQVRKYNLKEETGQQTHTQIGVIAQEVELVSPGLVSESPDRDEDGNDLGTVTKSVNYSVLYMKAVRALQEAMERIETLEAKVAALEAS